MAACVLFLHSRNRRDKRTSVPSRNAVIRTQAERTALPDSNIETLDRNHPEMIDRYYRFIERLKRADAEYKFSNKFLSTNLLEREKLEPVDNKIPLAWLRFLYCETRGEPNAELYCNLS